MIADLLHAGHVRVLQRAADCGEVTVGLLTDEAAVQIDDLPTLNYQMRKEVVSQLSMVAAVIPQTTASYKANLELLRPHYVVHGDEWCYNHLAPLRDEVIALLGRWQGELIEVPYSSEINDVQIKKRMASLGISTGAQREYRLRRLLASKPLLKILEVHNAISGIIAENTVAIDAHGKRQSYDGMWSSSLTDSIAKGKPDIEAVDTTSRLNIINEIFEVTNKPLIYDADTGGLPEHFAFTVRSLERTGVSAAIIEDKTGLKKNSLFGTTVPQQQDSIENFCNKIAQGKAAQLGSNFMIFARVESLILNAGMPDALRRAQAYKEAGADGIMIHSRHKQPDEIFAFMQQFRANDHETPLVVVPTSFNSVTTDEFIRRGANIVIYANHMLRAAYPAMQQVAVGILQNGRTQEIEHLCTPINEVLELIPGTK